MGIPTPPWPQCGANSPQARYYSARVRSCDIYTVSHDLSHDPGAPPPPYPGPPGGQPPPPVGFNVGQYPGYPPAQVGPLSHTLTVHTLTPSLYTLYTLSPPHYIYTHNPPLTCIKKKHTVPTGPTTTTRVRTKPTGTTGSPTCPTADHI